MLTQRRRAVLLSSVVVDPDNGIERRDVAHELATLVRNNTTHQTLSPRDWNQSALRKPSRLGAADAATTALSTLPAAVASVITRSRLHHRVQLPLLHVDQNDARVRTVEQRARQARKRAQHPALAQANLGAAEQRKDRICRALLTKVRLLHLHPPQLTKGQVGDCLQQAFGLAVEHARPTRPDPRDASHSVAAQLAAAVAAAEHGHVNE
eukprot:4944057-Pleurochrysis_carterae.AAC.1